MKKKILIASGIILIIFIFGLVFSLRQTKKTTPFPSPQLSQEKAAQQSRDDQIFSQTLTNLHEKYPWYSQLPLETKDYRIIYDFDKKSFRIRILTTSSETVRQAALGELKAIGVDLKEFPYYFLESESPFKQLTQ